MAKGEKVGTLNNLAIITYHQIGPSSHKLDIFETPLDHFISQIKFLASQVRSVSDGILELNNGRKACITFDDGTVDHYEAARILQSFNLPGIFFITSGRVGLPGYLTEEQIKEMLGNGHLIGSHARSHRPLEGLFPQEIQLELSLSKSELEKITGQQILWFSPPGGFYSPEVIKAAEETGYRVIRTSDWGYASFPPKGFVPSFPISKFLAMDEFRRILDGRKSIKLFLFKEFLKSILGKYCYNRLRKILGTKVIRLSIPKSVNEDPEFQQFETLIYRHINGALINAATEIETVAPHSNKKSAELLLNILEKLEQNGILYVVLTPSTEKPPEVSSDVDMALAGDPRSSVEPILLDLEQQGKIEILQRLYYEIPAGYYYMLRLCHGEGLQLLHLDCLFDPSGADRYGTLTPALISERQREWWGYRPNDCELAVYYLIKRAVKGSPSANQLAQLQRLMARADRSELEDEVKRLVGDKAGGLIAELTGANTVAEAVTALEKFRRLWFWRRRMANPLKWLYRSFRISLRLIHRFFTPTGLFVILLGPDGCGKSTLATAISNHLARCYRRVWRFHWRPGLLPKLSKGDFTPSPLQLVEPPREVKYGTFVSLVRYLYYLADFIAGYWFLIYPRKAATTLVIGERWHYDVIVNPQRYGFRLPRWLLRLGQWLIPRPNLVLLLTASPEMIHRRKPELTLEEIQTQIEDFRAIFTNQPRVVEVDTGVQVPETVRQVQQVILGETRRITGRRLGGAPEWRGFGPQTDPKVWRHRDEKPGQALQLYQPASLKGRLAKLAASLAPGMISECFFFRVSPTPAEAARLRRHVDVVRRVLAEPEAIVSFGTGSPGPDRKLTAQVSVGQAVRAYVKIGDDAVAQLLDTEARALSRGVAAHRATFHSPSLMADVSEGGYRYLFLEAARAGARPRPLQPDRLDRLFLLHWLEGQRQVPVEKILSKVLPAASCLEGTEAKILANVQTYVREAFKNGGVRVWPSHGDYAPWNTLLLQDGSLYVFDWEHFNEQAPALQDLFHRIFMPGRLVEGLSPAQIVKRLLGIPADPVFGPVIANSKLSTQELPAYLMLYLLGMMKWRGLDDLAFRTFLIACMRTVFLHVGFKGYRKMVLVSAYACEPGKGSEAGVGWHWVQAIANHADAWVITKGNNRGPIENELGSGLNERLRFEYVELPRWLAFWKKGPRGVRLYYYLWQFAALARARKLLKSNTFDLAHHVTFVNDWTWTFLALLPIPFIWGPIGSNIGIPRQLLENRWSGLLDIGKRSLQSMIRLVDPLYWLAVRRAAKILCINDKVAHSLPFRVAARGKITIEPAIAVEELPGAWPLASSGRAGGRRGLRVLFMGKFIPIKGPGLALEAFAQLASKIPEARLTMVGDGPLLGKLQQQANGLNVGEKVHFVPWLPRSEALRLFGAHDVFLFPSMEGGGMVVLEAMASGVPVVCLDFGGPGQMVTPEVGIKVKIRSRSEVIHDLTKALFLLSKDHSWFEDSKRKIIKQKVRTQYSWEEKERLIAALYEGIV